MTSPPGGGEVAGAYCWTADCSPPARIALASSMSLACRSGLSLRSFCRAASSYGPRIAPSLAM